MDKTGSLSPISINSTCSQHVQLQNCQGTNNARPKNSKKNGNLKKKKNDFYPKMKVFHNTGKILCLMKTILCHTQSHANLTLIRIKTHTCGQKKRPTL